MISFVNIFFIFFFVYLKAPTATIHLYAARWKEVFFMQNNRENNQNERNQNQNQNQNQRENKQQNEQRNQKENRK